MKRFILLTLTLFIAHSIFAQVQLKKGTAIFVELTTEANSNNKHEIMAVVGIDVNDSKTGETLITKGTPIVLRIERRKSRGLGKAGWLQIKPISVTAIDGRQILLDGGFSREGEQHRGVALGLGIGLGLTYLPGFGFFFLMLKGEKIVLPKGTTIYDVFIKENYQINIYN